MSENSDEKLESMLRSRHVEAADPALATRIMLKAQTLEQLRNVTLWQWVRQSFAEFHLPRPAFVLAAALVLGLFVGFTTGPEKSAGDERYPQTTQLLLSGEEGLL